MLAISLFFRLFIRLSFYSIMIERAPSLQSHNDTQQRKTIKRRSSVQRKKRENAFSSLIGIRPVSKRCRLMIMSHHFLAIHFLPLFATPLSLAIRTILRVTIKSSHFIQKTAIFVSYLSPPFPNPDSILPTSHSSFIHFNSSSPSPIFLPSLVLPRCCLLFRCG